MNAGRKPPTFSKLFIKLPLESNEWDLNLGGVLYNSIIVIRNMCQMMSPSNQWINLITKTNKHKHFWPKHQCPNNILWFVLANKSGCEMKYKRTVTVDKSHFSQKRWVFSAT